MSTLFSGGGVRRNLTSIRNALAFLSRIVPPASHNGSAIAEAVPWYPFAGLILGLAAALPTLALPGHLPWIGGVAYVLILAWLTRGLHWDGLADLADACGSNAQGERFWQIMKDSHIGAFGVLALILAIAFQTAAAQYCLAGRHAAALILAPAFGRAIVIILGKLTMPAPHSTLAALMMPGTRTPGATLSLILSLVAVLLLCGPAVTALALALTAPCLYILVRIAANHGGANGDFCGAVVIVSETALLLAATLR